MIAKNNSKIDILMATYNGESFILEQLNSIASQTYTNWNLIIRDDGSTDSTLSIIENFSKTFPDKVSIVKDEIRNLGPCLNFGKLLTYSSSDYTMFCDQDDIWLENKIEITFNEMIKLEKENGQETPIVIHTDLKVVDEKLNVISNSFFEFRNLNPDNANKLNLLICDNVITGCTMLINKSLKNKVCIESKDIVMHDWWIGIIACTFGKISVIRKPTILYRQHSKNSVGAKERKLNMQFFIQKFNLKTVNNSIKFERLLQNQIKTFLDIYDKKSDIKPSLKRILYTYALFDSYTFLKKKILRIRYKFFQSSNLKNLFLLIIN